MTSTACRALALGSLTALLAGLAACGETQDDANGSTGNASSTSRSIAIELTMDGCTPTPASAPAGPITFTVNNKDAAATTEVELVEGSTVIGEKENVAPGFSGRFSLRVTGGDYRIYCPGTTNEYTDFTVSGEAATANGEVTKLLAQGSKDYDAYVHEQALGLVRAVKPLVAAIRANDLAGAQKAYATARISYERVEPVAETFKELDPQIDARAGDVPASEWTGFHPIEKALFADRRVTGLDSLATGLLANVQKLAALTAQQDHQPAEVLNGAGGLLDEVSASKITGEEERYSHIDMVDFRANVDGAEKAFATMKPALATIDPDLTSQIEKRFAAVDTLLDDYRDPSALGGFVRYGKLTTADKRALANAVNALKAPLGQAGSKVAAAG